MKGIILAGGSGTRLWPLTVGTSKQLLPVYDKPMIYHPLSTLILAGISEILVITTPHEAGAFRRLLGDGTGFGVNLEYAVQAEPNGLAQAFTIGRDFIQDESVCLILGDNIFHGLGLGEQLSRHRDPRGAEIFAYRVSNPHDYGIVEFDDDGHAKRIVEKPAQPQSQFAVPGLYFYDNRVVALAEGLKPSARGELEISEINQQYLQAGMLTVEILPRGTAWLDTGTFASLQEAGNFVRTLQKRQGYLVGCPEEAAWRRGLLSDDELRSRGEALTKSGYGEYLLELLEDELDAKVT